MSKTYKRERTKNKARQTRAVERAKKVCDRILNGDEVEEMLEFIECCHRAKAERDACNDY